VERFEECERFVVALAFHELCERLRDDA
jgi:hypothetical protein